MRRIQEARSDMSANSEQRQPIPQHPIPHHKDIGDLGETLAAQHLTKEGYQILGQKLQCPLGELDLVALDGEQVVIVEVKTRIGRRAGRPEDAVTPAKQRQITRVALSYLKSENRLECSVRFDVIGIELSESLEVESFRHYLHAFDAANLGRSLY